MLHFHQSIPQAKPEQNPEQKPEQKPQQKPQQKPEQNPEQLPDWLAPHHPILNATFPPITAMLNRPTYHKSAKGSPPPFPKSVRAPQFNE